jgi:AraC-like DNA-binding protein
MMKDNRFKSTYYVPYQPGFEQKINYRHFIVQKGQPLWGMVSDFYQFEVIHSIANEICVIPDGCIDFLFRYGHDGITQTVEGFYHEKRILPINQEGCAFGVRFLPGAVTSILKINASELIATQIPLMDLLEKDFLLDQMGGVESFDERIHHMTTYLLKKMTKTYGSQEIVRYCTQTIIAHQGNVLMTQLSEETTYTLRYLRQLFYRHVGVSPKEFSEMIQFQNSFRRLSQLQTENRACSLGHVAIQSGYYDQSHMNKSYQKIVGCLPKELHSEMSVTRNA